MLRKCIGKLNIPNFIHDFGDIFEIGKHRDEIVEMDGFGEKSFETLMTSLDKAKDFQCLSHLYGFIDDSPVHF